MFKERWRLVLNSNREGHLVVLILCTLISSCAETVTIGEQLGNGGDAPGDQDLPQGWFAIGSSEQAPHAVRVTATMATGPGISESDDASATTPDVTINAAGELGVVWQVDATPNQVMASQWVDYLSAWVPRGLSATGGISDTADRSWRPRVASSGETFQVAWMEDANGWQIYVRQWDGPTITSFGGSAESTGVSGTSGESEFAAIAVNSAGFPVIAWAAGGGGDTEIYVREWTGSSWEPLGASASGGGISDTPTNSSVPAIAVDGNGRPVVAWEENLNTILVRRFTGSTWEELAFSGTTGISGGGPARAPTVAIDSDGNPVVAWSDSSSGTAQIHARYWHEQLWDELAASAQNGGISDTTGASIAPSLTRDPRGRLLVAWQEGTGASSEIYARRFDQEWLEISGSASGGGVSNSALVSEAPAVAAGGNMACIAWSEPDSAGDRQILMRCHH